MFLLVQVLLVRSYEVFVWNCLVHLHFWNLSLSAFHSTISFLLLLLLRSQLPEVPLKVMLAFFFSLLFLRFLYVIVFNNFNTMHLKVIFFVLMIFLLPYQNIPISKVYGIFYTLSKNPPSLSPMIFYEKHQIKKYA